MGQFVKDIQFMEELVKDGDFTKTLCLTLVDDKGFYKPNRNNAGIYSYFRLGTPIKGNIEHQINQTHYQYYITGNYNIKWCSLTEKVKYYIVEIPSKG